MLGGSFWIAFLRNGMGAGLMLAVFLLLDRPRLPLRKAIWCYGIFGTVVTAGFSFWYLFGSASFVRFAGMLTIPVIGIFCIAMSRETLYLSLYKLALGFYMLSLVVACGVDMSALCFSGNVWADISVRFVLIAVLLFVTAAKIRKSFLEGMDYLREEMDWVSMIAVFVSILFAALLAFWPDTHTFSAFHIVRTLVLLFMAGMIQYMVFQMYLHRGRERRYQSENRLLEMNEQLMQSQLELLHESERMRHTIRHHNFMIEEYIRKQDTDKLLAYVKEYWEEEKNLRIERICGNEAINSILAIWARRAADAGIQVKLDVHVSGDIAIRDMDLAAVISNIFENAIQGCIASMAPVQEIYLSIMQKRKKMVLQCQNTYTEKVKLKKRMPETNPCEKAAISSVMKVVSYYKGEAEFVEDSGMFTARILLNVPERQSA